MSGICCIQTGIFACWHCSHFLHFLVVDKASVYRGVGSGIDDATVSVQAFCTICKQADGRSILGFMLCQHHVIWQTLPLSKQVLC